MKNSDFSDLCGCIHGDSIHVLSTVSYNGQLKLEKQRPHPIGKSVINSAFGKQLQQMSGQDHLVVAKSCKNFQKHSWLLGTYCLWDQQTDLGHGQFQELLEAVSQPEWKSSGTAMKFDIQGNNTFFLFFFFFLC